MPKQSDALRLKIEKFQKYFEANLLDGNNIHTESKGTILSAQSVFEVVVEYITDVEALFTKELKEVERKTAKEIRTIFDMSEFDPTGTMMDEHMMARTPGEIEDGKRYNRDHAWAALSAQSKIDKYIAELT